ncbi:hypothetical protein MMC20_007849 [Loxospora ochrophaea]|nr:hypothetical protein [Loxospora ochrophaea]
MAALLLTLSFLSMLLGSDSLCIRNPPTYNLPANPDWIAPPTSFYLGNWKITYGSQPTLNPLYDIQQDWGTLANASGEPIIDLASFHTFNSTTIYTEYGIDTPHYPLSLRTRQPYAYEGVYDFKGTGNLSNEKTTWEILTYGKDTAGHEFAVFTEDAIVASGAPPDMLIYSKSAQGPTLETLAEISDAVHSLRIPKLNALFAAIKPYFQDGLRDGQPPAIDSCGELCQNNKGPTPPV